MSLDHHILFSAEKISKAKEKSEASYFEYLHLLREETGSGFDQGQMGIKFYQWIPSCLESEVLNQYHYVHFYFLEQLEEYLEAVAILSDEDLDDEREELLFEFWNDSEFAQAFSESYQERGILKLSEEFMRLKEEVLIAFFEVQIIGKVSDEQVRLYQATPGWGDFDGKIYFPKFQLTCELPSAVSKEFPTIPISNLSLSEQHFEVILEDGPISVDSFSETDSVKLGNKNILLQFLYNPKDRKKEIHQKAQVQLEFLQKASPKFAQFVEGFTHIIVPIDEPGVVSYSTQQIPGANCLNISWRNERELLDDFVHESGHQYLNCLLNSDDLIQEDDELIYYSPWRESYRHIRGIYHAVFTFYWGMLLFKDLKERDNLFQTEDIGFFEKRYQEELIKISYCEEIIDHAHQDEKVSETGLEIIKQVFSSVKNEMKNLNFDESQQEIISLKSHLLQKQKILS